jgi:putative endonuclease
MDTRAIGEHWEYAALTHLRQAGLELVARNYHCRHGEIDLVMLDRSGRDGDTLVFVEVRYRDDATRGSGTVSVGAAKQRKLIHAAQAFLQANARFANLACRFDVIGCAGTPQQPVFEWTRNAFDAI